MYPNSPEKESPKIGIELLKEGRERQQTNGEREEIQHCDICIQNTYNTSRPKPIVNTFN